MKPFEKVLKISVDIPVLGLEKGAEFPLIDQTDKEFIIFVETENGGTSVNIPKEVTIITGYTKTKD